MKMTLMQHFRELRNRIIWSVLFFLIAFGVGIVISELLKKIVIFPLMSVWDNPSLIYTGLADGVIVEFSLAGLFAMLVSVPFFLWQAWKYVAPALKKNEKNVAAAILLTSPLLFLGGAAFAYFVLFPMAFKFFVGFSGSGITLMPNLREYLSLTIGLLKAFGVAFQFPLILVILNRAGLFSKRQIFNASRYIIVGIFVIAAILTPPDIISQITLSMPMILLFGLSFLFMRDKT